ncbi:MAG: DUF5709 domain-containing protein [Streptomyces sp.]|uniref:DUF5709 domain-containing protein n=1 Tax=Streptomyces sp. TaxID=1931 RepID=UPI003D6BEA97
MTEDEPHDPGAEPEDEGMPDLRAESPEAELASDPERTSIPGDEPVAVERYGTTFAEQVEGESLDEKLSEEEPDVGEEAAEQLENEQAGQFEAGQLAAEQAGQLSDDPLSWRPANQDSFSTASPAHGLSVEETAMHVADDDESGLGLDLEAIEEAEEAPDPRPEPPAGPEYTDPEAVADEDG